MSLHLPLNIVRAMLKQARREAPKECLGLLFGKDNRVLRRVPLKNVSPAPEVRFEAAAEGLLAALQEADARGDELVAIYHSHPQGPLAPSSRDLEEARYGVPIIVLAPESGVVRAFDLMQAGYRERDIVVWTENWP